MKNSIIWRHENGAIKVPFCGKAVRIQHELLPSTPSVSTCLSFVFLWLLRWILQADGRRLGVGATDLLILNHLEGEGEGRGGAPERGREWMWETLGQV